MNVPKALGQLGYLDRGNKDLIVQLSWDILSTHNYQRRCDTIPRAMAELLTAYKSSIFLGSRNSEQFLQCLERYAHDGHSVSLSIRI
jgi:hypothetical protein